MTEDVRQNVMIVERDAAPTRLLLELLAARGVRGSVVRDARAAGERLQTAPWDLVVTALHVPHGGGLEVLRQAKLRDPELPVVMMAREPSMRSIVRAVRDGATEFLVKPLRREAAGRVLDTCVPNHAVAMADAADADSRPIYRIVGRSPQLLRTLDIARRVAPTAAPVLVTGESGTGKELVAHLIHHASRRADGPYIRMNCAALSETLLESELFGHERGAFTGAVRDRKGRFERADGGTILLDEVTETGPRLQAELLRVLEGQEFERVGGSERVRVNVRLIATTNRDLAGLVRQGKFRPDLYYRLAGVRLPLPPLRDRREDIPLLAWHFVNEFAREARRSVGRLDQDMMDLFGQYHWPGNVRQLRNVVRTAMILGTGATLSLAEAPWLRAELAQPATPECGRGGGSLRLRDVERRAILQAIRRTGSHQAKAAELLGITDRTLRAKLRRYREEGLLPEEEEGEKLWVSQPA
jgi:two-component system response regulator HydG